MWQTCITSWKVSKLKSLSFSRVSEVALGSLLGTKLGGVLPLRMCHKAMLFVICRVCWPQDVANLRNKLKSLSFSRVSEVALDSFLGFLCYVLGTKLGGVLPLRMCHKAVPFVIGGLVGCKMWQTCITSWKVSKLKSLSFSRVSEVAFGPLFRVPLLRFGHEIRWCFAVAHVPQSHALCDLPGLLAARWSEHA